MTEGQQRSSRMKKPLLFAAEVVLLIGFVASIIGIMVIYNHNISLQLLLEEERGYGKEMERVNGDLRLEVSRLQAHNIQREGRFAEMQVTISTLRDGLRAVQSALQEKESKTKMLRQRYAQAEAEASQVHSLFTALRDREAEIQHLKQSLRLSEHREENVTSAEPYPGSSQNATSENGIDYSKSSFQESENGDSKELRLTRVAEESTSVQHDETSHLGMKMSRRKLARVLEKRQIPALRRGLTGRKGRKRKAIKRTRRRQGN